MEDELLPVLLKLVQGNKELCFELIQTVRQKHPDKPMHWCIQKAIYDTRFRPTAKPALKPTPHPIAVKPASGVTKNRLDSLTKDRRVSDRLVQRLLLMNPERSEQWAYEKAIYDLERDRV